MSEFLPQVYHEAFVDVTEEGTEAAGATAGAATRKEDPFAVNFQANRPFLFIIKEHRTNSLLFMGRFMKPEWF